MLSSQCTFHLHPVALIPLPEKPMDRPCFGGRSLWSHVSSWFAPRSLPVVKQAPRGVCGRTLQPPPAVSVFCVYFRMASCSSSNVGYGPIGKPAYGMSAEYANTQHAPHAQNGLHFVFPAPSCTARPSTPFTRQ